MKVVDPALLEPFDKNLMVLIWIMSKSTTNHEKDSNDQGQYEAPFYLFIYL